MLGSASNDWTEVYDRKNQGWKRDSNQEPPTQPQDALIWKPDEVYSA